MVFPRSTNNALAFFACLALCCNTTTSSLDAQQQTAPNAPRLFNPQTRAISSQYQPRFMQPASSTTTTAVQGSSSRAVQGSGSRAPVIEQSVINQNPQFIDQGPVSGTVVNGAPIGDIVVDDGTYFDEAYVDGGCDSCGGSGCFGCGPLVDPRDCRGPSGYWFGELGKILCNTEYFAGVQGFTHQEFASPTGIPTPENDSFGAHVGFNTGLPLYRLTGGLVSGQIGVNYVGSNFNDGVLATGDRQQTFITFGLFRRVDYGLQFGVVADVLNEDFVAELDIVQTRAELSWVFGNGSNAGFRWTNNVQDDQGLAGGAFVTNITSEPIDTYRLFHRKTFCNAGYLEFAIGRSDEQHTIFGAELDIPIHNRTAFYAGFNYLHPDDEIPLTDNEAWNLQMGLSFRPRGNDWYKFYHRPLFRVGDNGSFVQSRRGF